MLASKWITQLPDELFGMPKIKNGSSDSVILTWSREDVSGGCKKGSSYGALLGIILLLIFTLLPYIPTEVSPSSTPPRPPIPSTRLSPRSTPPFRKEQDLPGIATKHTIMILGTYSHIRAGQGNPIGEKGSREQVNESE